MKTKLLFLTPICALLAAFPARAQVITTETETKTVEDVTADRSPEEVAARIAELQNYLGQRQERAAELATDIMTLDKRIESRIDRIVGMLDGITDSLESSRRVSELKKRAIDGLKSTIEFYDQKRRALQEETRQRDPRITREELFNDIGKFDDRIDKRVDQILDLAKSMQSHKDYDKWTVVEDGGRSRWGDDYYRTRNPRYYQNRQESTATAQEVEQLVEEINSGIDRLSRSNRDIEEKLKANITPQYREMLQDELARNNGIIETREAQKEDLVMSQDPDTQSVGRDQALNIESMIQDMAEDLEQDNNAMFQLYYELNLERAAITEINKKLEALGANPVPTQLPTGSEPESGQGAP